jgi:hypothetical protein
MVHRAPRTGINPLEGGAQWSPSPRGQGLQHAGHRRLVGTRVASPGGGARGVRPETGGARLDGGAIRAHTDHHVEPFLGGRMADGLAAALDMRPQRREDISVV